MKKILIVAERSRKKIASFLPAAKRLGMDVTIASFLEITYEPGINAKMYIRGIDVESFDTIYIRLIGRRVENLTLLVRHARQHGIRVIDRLYEKPELLPSSLTKYIELMKLAEKGVPIPKTYFGSVKLIQKNTKNNIGFPAVVKSTTGRKAREVWLVENQRELAKLCADLLIKEKEGLQFFVQKAIESSHRIRVMVVGDKAIGGFIRPTKWRKHYTLAKEGKLVEQKINLNPVPDDIAQLAIKAAKAADLDISGIDILKEDITGEMFIIEANAAPAWDIIKKKAKVQVEEEILKFIQNYDKKRFFLN